MYFDSYPERIVGLLLYKYGLADSFREGENLHVRTSEDNKRASIDFLVGNTFIEFHPLGITDFKRNHNLKQAGNRKRKNITKPEYQDYKFYHIWEIGQLYDILQKTEIKTQTREEYHNLTREEFHQHVSETYREAIEYDSKKEK